MIENAGEGPAQVDLRAIETRNAMSRLMNAYEVTTAGSVSVVGNYEAATATDLGLAYATWGAYNIAAAGLGIVTGPANWSAATANPIWVA